MTQLITGIIGVAPLYVLSILSSVQSIISGETPVLDPASSATSSLLVFAVFGGWVMVLLYSICGENLASLQLKAGRIWTDLKHGLALGCNLLLVVLVFGAVTRALGQEDIPAANRAIATALAGNNLLLIIWLGPVIWLQAAVLEELYRAFLLTRLWRVWPSQAGRVLTVIGYSLFFGLGHAYQGPLGIVGTGLIGLVLGWHYMKNGRLLPLIIAHGLYDSCVILSSALLIRHGFI